MSALGARDLLTLPRVEEQVNEGEDLRVLSPRHKPWDIHRGEADDVMEAFAGSEFMRHHRYAERVAMCSQVLGFARDPPTGKLQLKNARFCRVRQCPVCQWRRSLMWQAKVARALPKLLKDLPDVRFLFLTLTLRNCPMKDLRATLSLMGKAWKRFTELRQWPARGWVRGVEVTRSERFRDAHPHYHALLVVPPSYFQGDYLKHAEWGSLWRQCLRIDYDPVVHIKAIQLALVPKSRRVTPLPKNLWYAVAEVLKYAVKPSDMVRDYEWFRGLVDQLYKTRAVEVGGILKHYIKEREKEDLKMEPGEALSTEEVEQLFFGWKQDVRRYRKML